MPRITGSIAAEFTAAGGMTQLRSHRQSYPLKLAKTFPFPQEQLGVYVMDASPGIMGGDGYELDWKFGPGTRVYVTNQSYTKVHPSRSSSGEEEAHPSTQQQRLWLGEGAYVEYMPEPSMLYKDASFRAETVIEMERGAALFYSDILVPGRIHRGELFRFREHRGKLTVRYGGELIFASKLKVCPAEDAPPLSVARWDEYPHLGSLYLFSSGVQPAHVESLREHLQELSASSGGSLYWGVSRTYKYGLSVTVLGQRVFEIAGLLEAAWTFLRNEVFGLAPLSIPK